ncbi:MAG: ATP synthase F1 subunit delta [Dehalococcoidales bacterium]|nr:ATP synthase F1 subunit delta [Dehalococcoidales bacterium]
MPRKFNARRYAQAVFEIARENNELDRWASDLERLATVLADARLVSVLESPKVGFEDKSRLLEASLGDVSPLALNVARLLVSRGGLGMAGKILEEYERRLNEHRGVLRAEVTAAVPLDKDDEAKLAAGLARLMGKTVSVRSRVDPAILGGIIARIDGKVLDGSTRSRLFRLRKALRGET